MDRVVRLVSGVVDTHVEVGYRSKDWYFVWVPSLLSFDYFPVFEDNDDERESLYNPDFLG